MKQNIKNTSGQFYKYRFLLICICLAAAIIAVYWPVHGYDFVRYDDSAYVVNNINIQSGLNLKSLQWAFTSGYASNWHPLTWISHMLDYQLFKDWAGGYHLVNVLFHILNTLILFYVFVLMTGATWPSAFIAAVFALHPLHVESVAWVAERKDVLSTFFWLLTMLAYASYVKNQKIKWYLFSFILFILGLLSKPMLVTIPFVLLLLDYWPLERKFSLRLFMEKIPFFICSIASCVATFLVQQKGGAVIAFESFGPMTRINNTIVSYIEYIIKMIWPSRLALLYPHPGSGLSAAKVVISGFVLLLLSIYFIYMARRRRFFAVGWLWYLGALVPVIGLIQVGPQAIADRYTYMTLTGLFIIIAFSAKEFVPRSRYKMLAVFSAAILLALFLSTSRQLKYWKNSQILFGRAIEVTKDNYMMLDNYGSILVEQGRLDEAVGCFRESLRIYPESAAAHNNLGGAMQQAGRIQQAIECFRSAIKCDPNFWMANFNLAAALHGQGKPEEAVFYYKQALKIKPDDIDAGLKLAIVYNELGKTDLAIESFNKVIALAPDNVSAHGYRSLTLASVGRIDEAIEDIRFVLNARPDDIMMHRNLGIFLERKGDIAQAIKSYRAALQLDPNNENLRQLLENALKKQTAP